MTSRIMQLTDRLRGVYTIPVNDGAGLLNGSPVYTRNFETPPIQHEAANEIERLILVLLEIADPNKTNDARQLAQVALFGRVVSTDEQWLGEALVSAFHEKQGRPEDIFEPVGPINALKMMEGNMTLNQSIILEYLQRTGRNKEAQILAGAI